MPSRYGLSIRAADLADLEGLATLLAAVEVTIPRDRLASRLRAVVEQPGAVLLAEEWGPPSGVIAVHWNDVLTSDQKVGWVSLLIVDPERRRSGVGRLLLKAASQAARSAGCGELLLQAPEHAPDVRAFSLATGFKEAGSALSRPLRKRS